MGDEIGLLNDHSFLEEPDKRDDNRWMHRPRLDWEQAARRSKPVTVEHRIFSGLRALIEARKRTPHLHAAIPVRVLDPLHPHVFSFTRPHPLDHLLALHNFTEKERFASRDPARSQHIHEPFDRISRKEPATSGDDLRLAPYQALWITEA